MAVFHKDIPNNSIKAKIRQTQNKKQFSRDYNFGLSSWFTY